MEDNKVYNQMNIFDILGVEEDWKKEWQDMPEFIQEDLTPHQQIIISFESDNDVKDFAKLINQKLTYKTKSIWFPETQRGKFKDYSYVDNNISESVNYIPKRFIRIWLGNKSIPEQHEIWWQELKDMHPNYEFITIKDDNDIIIPETIKHIFDNAETYSERTDVLRVLALYQIGGIYIDTDFMPLKPFDDLLKDPRPFLGIRSSKSFEASIIGSPKGHIAFKELIEIWPEWIKTPSRSRLAIRVLNTLYGRKDINHCPTTFFYPYDGFMGPKRDEKEEMFKDKSQFPEEMIAAHFSNRIWGGNPNKQRNEK